MKWDKRVPPGTHAERVRMKSDIELAVVLGMQYLSYTACCVHGGRTRKGWRHL